MTERSQILSNYVCPDCSIDLTSDGTCTACGSNFMDEICSGE